MGSSAEAHGAMAVAAIVVALFLLSEALASPCYELVLGEPGAVTTVSSDEAGTGDTCWNVRTKDRDMHVHATVTRLRTELGRAIVTYRANATDDRVLAAYSGTACAYYVWRDEVYAAPFKLEPGGCTHVSEGNTLHILFDRDAGAPFSREDTFEIKLYATKMRLFNVKELIS